MALNETRFFSDEKPKPKPKKLAADTESDPLVDALFGKGFMGDIPSEHPFGIDA